MFGLRRSRLRELVTAHETKRGIYAFFSEIRAAHRRALLFESILETLFVTMVSLAIGRFLIMPWYWMLLLPAVYLFVRIIMISRVDGLIEAERTFPSFREQFLTVRDNFTKTHEMETALEQDVLERSHEVESSGFFDPRRFSIKIIAIIMLFFITSFATPFTYEMIPPFWHEFTEGEDGIFDPNFWFWQRSSLTGIDGSGDIDSIDIIYGDPTEIFTGPDILPLELAAGKDALGLSERDEGRSLSERYVSRHIDAVGSEYFEESIPIAKHEVVRNYFREE